MVPMPPIVVLFVCRAVLGQPDDNTQFTHHLASGWNMTDGVMHCRRMEVMLYDQAPDQGADPQDFNNWHCNRAGVRYGAQYDIDNWNKPWRFWRYACPVKIMNDSGTPSDPRDDVHIGWKIPECPALKGVLECEADTAI